MPTSAKYFGGVTNVSVPDQVGTFNAREFTITGTAALQLMVNRSSAPAATAIAAGDSTMLVQPYAAVTLVNTDPSTCYVRSNSGTAAPWSVMWTT